jgi:hypothetical protein
MIKLQTIDIDTPHPPQGGCDIHVWQDAVTGQWYSCTSGVIHNRYIEGQDKGPYRTKRLAVAAQRGADND